MPKATEDELLEATENLPAVLVDQIPGLSSYHSGGRSTGARQTGRARSAQEGEEQMGLESEEEKAYVAPFLRRAMEVASEDEPLGASANLKV
jgi:hypothetical protein